MNWEEVELPQSPIDVFWSVCRFTEDFKNHVHEKGSVKGIDNLSAYSDHILFDIDDADLERAHRIAIQLIDRLATIYGVPVDAVEVYFSGKKGFHLLIPAKLIGWTPSPVLHKIMKALAKKIAGKIPDKLYFLWREG